MSTFDNKRPDGNSPDGEDPPLYPKQQKPQPVSDEELKKLLPMQRERRPK